MITIDVNDRKISAQPGEPLLDAMRRAGIHVPTLCHLEGLFPSGACRLCSVEVKGERSLVPSCAFPVREGLQVQTHSARAVKARKTIVELLLSNHPDDCLYCVRNSDCDLRGLAAEFGVSDRRFRGARTPQRIDVSSPYLVRDQAKCILCGRCVRVCEEVQDVAAIDFIGRGSKTRVGAAFDAGLNVSTCIGCGQCIVACPTGALHEQSHLEAVIEALGDPDTFVVVQHAPAVSVTLAEELGLEPGTDVAGTLTAGLRHLGFDRVFDTSFSADLTIMEEASELVHRVKTGGVLPMMTSCSPGWIRYVETFHPDFIPNLSSCKSPQQMMGALIKSFYAEQQGVDPDRVFSVSLMPCTAKKYEAQRGEMTQEGRPDVDAVLTTRELARLIRMRGLDLKALSPDTADTPFGERSSAGKLFGATGGVMEAALRTAHWMITGRELGDLEVRAVRGLEGAKEAKVSIDGLEIGVAVVSGLGNARKLLDQLKAGREDLHFIEVMTCPGGCINGGGQPHGTEAAAVRARMQALYKIDAESQVRTSHSNESVRRLYEVFLGEPLGERSHHLLHTHYHRRPVVS